MATKKNSFHPEFPTKNSKCAPMSPAARVVPWLQKSYWPWFRFAHKFHGKLRMQRARVRFLFALNNLKMISVDQALIKSPGCFFSVNPQKLCTNLLVGVFSVVFLLVNFVL